MLADDLELKVIEDKEEQNAAISFFGKVLSHKMDPKIWDWEFNTFPGTVLTIIKKDDTVAGAQFMMPVALNINGGTAMTGKSENSHLDPQYRGKGLFQKLYAYAETVSVKCNMLLLWGFTSAVYVFEQTLKFVVTQDVMCDISFVMSMPSRQFYKMYSKGLMGFLKMFLFYLKQNSAYKSKHSLFCERTKYAENIKRYTVNKSVKSFDDLADLYQKIRMQYKDFAHLEMNEAYYNWRIANNPNLDYTTRFFYKNNALAGYYLVAANQFSANISDFTALDDEAANVMICHLLHEVSKPGVLNINYFGNIDNELNKRIFDLLANFGGTPVINKDMNFVYKSLSDLNVHDPVLRHSKNWYLNGLWTEGFSY